MAGVALAKPDIRVLLGSWLGDPKTNFIFHACPSTKNVLHGGSMTDGVDGHGFPNLIICGRCAIRFFPNA